jgi:transcriptional regulator with XRE-family HTH domain
MNAQITFVARLRRQRQRKGISLDDIARQTRVKRELLEAFEDNDLSGWPRGLYARAWVRGYAAAVGLDPADTVDEFCRLYLHGDRRARSTMRDMATMAEADSGYQEQPPFEERRRGQQTPAGPPWLVPVSSGWRAMRARLWALWALYFVKPRTAPRTSSS